MIDTTSSLSKKLEGSGILCIQISYLPPEFGGTYFGCTSYVAPVVI